MMDYGLLAAILTVLGAGMVAQCLWNGCELN